MLSCRAAAGLSPMLAPEAGMGAGCWLLTNQTAAAAAERPKKATRTGVTEALRFGISSRLCGCGVLDLEEIELEVGGSEGLAVKRPLAEKLG